MMRMAGIVTALARVLRLDGRKFQSAVLAVGSGSARSIDRNAKSYAIDGYSKNVIVFRCIDIRAKSLASIPLLVGKTASDGSFIETPNSPVAQLLRRPNAVQTWRQFAYMAVAFRDIVGQTFIERLGSSPTAAPTELWPWLPYHMKVVEHKEKKPLPKAWVYDDGDSNNKRYWEVDQLDGNCEMNIWKTFNPLDRFLGMSAIQATAAAVDEHNSASAWNARMLDNSCAPDGAVKVEGRLTDEEFARLKKEIAEKFSGAKNARKPMLLEGGMEFVQYSLSPKDMDWLNGKNLSAREIAGGFGVPTQVIPIQGDQTFANYEQARLALWEDTIIPLNEEFMEFLKRSLSPVMGEFDLKADIDKVPAIAERRRQVWATVGAARFLTINEQREAVGYDTRPEKEADVIWAPAGQLPLDYDAGPDEPAKPPFLPAEDEDEAQDEDEDEDEEDAS